MHLTLLAAQRAVLRSSSQRLHLGQWLSRIAIGA